MVGSTLCTDRKSHLRWLNDLRSPPHGEQLRDWNTAQVYVRDADDARRRAATRSAQIRVSASGYEATLALARVCATR